ncbi:2-iminobutanoate/2-iminopropanoate deaminase [Silvibacterium bohemicum]|uniref:2-iminobutanoate/2-iminopropanoate deaminase n=1 Tax=Silvibacterium bohemicum TaxID=1577686 RepID=A0A841K7T3_9BACT|nr:RidA family protein [Silvibacterium bohemicum]MBB6147161.1 2-iminobutanoate/2-iminopropanoate deaminase [Silvibacterium bohemicum]
MRSCKLKHLLAIPALSAMALIFPIASQAQSDASAAPVVNIAKLPFSPGLQVGDTLYVSGHLGVPPAASKAPADPEDEARQVLTAVQETLHKAGMSMNDLVYVEVYCTDLKMYAAFNKAYGSFFTAPYPARDFIGIKDLLFGAHFEVMGIAVRNAAQNKAQPVAQ